MLKQDLKQDMIDYTTKKREKPVQHQLLNVKQQKALPVVQFFLYQKPLITEHKSVNQGHIIHLENWPGIALSQERIQVQSLELFRKKISMSVTTFITSVLQASKKSPAPIP